VEIEYNNVRPSFLGYRDRSVSRTAIDCHQYLVDEGETPETTGKHLLFIPGKNDRADRRHRRGHLKACRITEQVDTRAQLVTAG